ncbi:MAG: hypothetical protein LBH13_01525, partial [Cellulomonadaceae bacterium]|nr:hypothetical protein [Cellulomonadaceae bacterium]
MPRDTTRPPLPPMKGTTKARLIAVDVVCAPLLLVCTAITAASVASGATGAAVFFGVLSLIPLAGSLLNHISVYRKRRKVADAGHVKIQRSVFSDDDHLGSVQAQLAQLRSLSIQYTGKQQYRVPQGQIAGLINATVGDVQEFFRLLQVKGTEQQRRLAAVEYDSTLSK